MIVEGSYKSLIQGVSQQHPNQRLDGQLSAMLNMHPDAVTGLRRRRGFELLYAIQCQHPDVRIFSEEFSGARYVLVHDCRAGTVRVLGYDGKTIGQVQAEYLRGAPEDFSQATVSGFLGILNRKKVPEEHQTAGLPNDLLPSAFVVARAGDTSYSYSITLTDYAFNADSSQVSVSGDVYRLNFTLGDGTSQVAGKWSASVASFTQSVTHTGTDADIQRAKGDLRDYAINYAQSRNDWSAQHSGTIPNTGNWYGYELTYAFGVTATGLIMAFEQLWGQPFLATLRSRYNLFLQGNSLAVRSKQLEFLRELDVRTSAPQAMLITSGNSSDPQVPTKDVIPAKLPAALDGFVVGVGADLESRVYYKYLQADNAWVESARGGYVTELRNMPVLLSVETSAENLARYIRGSEVSARGLNYHYEEWTVTLDTKPFKGRLVGNEENNPTPDFVGLPLSGIAGFQGRLVLLCGNQVFMSCSNKYNEFYRPSVQSTNSTDPIAMFNLGISGVDFRYAEEFNKDLVLFSSSGTAVVSGASAITPDNALMYIGSTGSMQLDCPPLRSGKELMYTALNSQGGLQVGRLVPDSLIENQFIPEPMMLHVPTLYLGRCYMSCSSSMSGTSCFSNRSNVLLVHNSTYEGNQLLQNAWHLWELPYPVRGMWFIQDTLYVAVQARSTHVVVMSLNCTRGYETVPMLDAWTTTNVGIYDDFQKLVPWTPDSTSVYTLYDTENPQNPRQLAEVRNVDASPSADWVQAEATAKFPYGLRYTSSYELSPPVLRDQSGVLQASNDGARWLDVQQQVQNSSAYEYRVITPYDDSDWLRVQPAKWSRTDWDAGTASGSNKLWVRAPLDGSSVQFRCNSTMDLNVVGCSWSLQFKQRRKRWG